MSNPLDDPRVQPDTYVVHPTGYDDLFHRDKGKWCLYVVNGQAWGWSVRPYSASGPHALNRKGEAILESRGSGRNKARRWPLEEALRIALAHVDTHRINGRTALEASEHVRARAAAQA